MITPSRENRRVLVIDDNPAIHADFRKTLAGKSISANLADLEAELFGEGRPPVETPTFDVDSAMQGQEALQKVETALRDGKPYAMAFVDMRMPPGWDGLQTVQHLWKQDPDLQVVICTAYSDHSWQEIIGQLGVTDRLLILKKPFDAVEVTQLATALTEKRSLKREAGLKLDQLEQMVEERTEQLKQTAVHDQLTGLPNRVLLIERLTEAVQLARRDERRQCALLYLDFDCFKIVNDSLGHSTGDSLLRAIARRISEFVETVRGDKIAGDCSLAARLGGDEFVILLENIRGSIEAQEAAQRLLEALSRPYELEGRQIHSTASIGIASSELGYTCADEMLRDADIAMYRAKAGGKARLMTFSSEMHQEAVRRLNIENELRQSIEAGGLVLHYQPVVCLRSGALRGFEALVRWCHPGRGLVSPGDFIPVAEESGLIVPLGNWVFAEACKQLRAWQQVIPATSGLSISVNISRRQLLIGGLAQQFVSTARQAGVAPESFCLEITESLVMRDTEAAMQNLNEFRKAGFRIHMDDFGTGYSSLSYLHRLPLDAIKIDRAFINSMSERRDYAAVVNAIVSLAHNLGLGLIAEGVETADQVALLQALDCDSAQGYFLSRPLPADAATEFILGKQISIAA